MSKLKMHDFILTRTSSLYIPTPGTTNRIAVMCLCDKTQTYKVQYHKVLDRNGISLTKFENNDSDEP